MEKPLASPRTLLKILRKGHRLLNYNYRGERTFIIVPGLNHPKIVNLSNVTGLKYYEERMLFFLFLLKYSRTKIIYTASQGFNTDLFRYYLSLISDSEEEIEEKLSRLTFIEVSGENDLPLARKILKNKSAINKIAKTISDPKKTFLRCYNPTEDERKLSLKLGVPLFGADQKFDFVGTKSGSRWSFKNSGANIISGYNDLKDFDALCLAMARMVKKSPDDRRLMVKRNYSSSGKGNCIFYVDKFLSDDKIDVKKIPVEDLASSIQKRFKKCTVFQNPKADFIKYKKKFNESGGIVEKYIEGVIKYSPSTQVLITSSKKAKIVSTHEQILGGPDKQLYLGCIFPSFPTHRKLIIREGEKISSWLANKGIVGNFAIDYVVTYNKNGENPKVYPIEINLRKGGATHPFRLAYFLTGAKYNPKSGLLQCGKKPIYYKAVDFIESEKYKGLKPMEIISLINDSTISFKKNTKKGALVYMPGMVEESGRFGAICIGQSYDDVERYYKRLLKIVGEYCEKRITG